MVRHAIFHHYLKQIDFCRNLFLRDPLLRKFVFVDVDFANFDNFTWAYLTDWRLRFVK